MIYGFNPRTHTGCDPYASHVAYHAYVSIHAPTRGATLNTRETLFDNFKFQSTHPHGVRPKASKGSWITLSVSIHAPTRGATLFVILLLDKSYCFNPRTHTGCDIVPPIPIIINDGFNPRTHTGCDDIIAYKEVHSIVSIHAPTRGATPDSGDNLLVR